MNGAQQSQLQALNRDMERAIALSEVHKVEEIAWDIIHLAAVIANEEINERNMQANLTCVDRLCDWCFTHCASCGKTLNPEDNTLDWGDSYGHRFCDETCEGDYCHTDGKDSAEHIFLKTDQDMEFLLNEANLRVEYGIKDGGGNENPVP